jgi:hypothetical protein
MLLALFGGVRKNVGHANRVPIRWAGCRAWLGGGGDGAGGALVCMWFTTCRLV